MFFRTPCKHSEGTVEPSACACRNAHDRLAFAVHSFLLADGFRLVAVGKDAEEATTGS